MGAGREMSYHAARALLADEASSNAAGMGLVNVSIEESYQVNEDAFHDRIIKVRNPGQPNVCASDGARVFPLTDFPVRGLPTPTRAHLSLSKTPRSTQSRRRSPRMSRTSSSPPSP